VRVAIIYFCKTHGRGNGQNFTVRTALRRKKIIPNAQITVSPFICIPTPPSQQEYTKTDGGGVVLADKGGVVESPSLLSH
jgi:hypothetical protein